MELTEGRLSLAVLSACAALVLAAGGAWWVAADPERRPEPAQAVPPVIVVPEQVAPEPVQSDLASFLPEFPDNTVTRQVGRIDPDGMFVIHARTRKNGEYRLQYVCLGPGALSVRIRGTTEGEMLYDADCGGNIGTFQFRAASADTVVEVSRPGREPADVVIQIIDVE